MKKFGVTMVVLVGLSTVIMAEKRAITNKGEEVILRDNGTWIYAEKQQETAEKISFNRGKFQKSSDATFLVKSQKNDSGFYINPKKWQFNKAQGVKEYKFKLRNGDLYAMAITEQLNATIEALAYAGLSNARKASPNVKVIKKEYRMVNGLKVIYMEMQGNMKGIKFIYLGYYYADPSGVTQLVVFTSPNLVKKYRQDIGELLNGLVKQK